MRATVKQGKAVGVPAQPCSNLPTGALELGVTPSSHSTLTLSCLLSTDALISAKAVEPRLAGKGKAPEVQALSGLPLTRKPITGHYQIV